MSYISTKQYLGEKNKIEIGKRRSPEPVVEEPISPGGVKGERGCLSSVEDSEFVEQEPNFWEEKI